MGIGIVEYIQLMQSSLCVQHQMNISLDILKKAFRIYWNITWVLVIVNTMNEQTTV